MARLVVYFLFFTLLLGCKDDEEAEGGKEPQNKQDAGAIYSLEISGVQGEVSQGTKLNVVVQLKLNEQALSDFQATVEVSLQVTCGTNKSDISKQKFGTDGKATFSNIALDRQMSGKCTLRVTTNISGDELKKAKRFTLSSAMSAGQEYKFSDFEAGTLTLSGCEEAVFYTVAGDAAPTRVSGKEVEVDSSDGVVFVIDVPASGCELHHNGSFYSMMGVAEEAEPFKIKGIHRNRDNELVVVLPHALEGSTMVMYASTDNGTTWQAHASVSEGDNTFSSLHWANTTAHNQVLIGITENKQRRWLFAQAIPYADVATAGASAGKGFAVHGVDGQIEASLVKACGMRLFFSGSGYVREFHSGEDETLAPENGSLKDFFFIGTAEAGCQPVLQIEATDVAITLSGTALSIPSGITLIADPDPNRSNIRLKRSTLNSVPSDFPQRFEYYLSNDGGGGWHRHRNNSTLPWRYAGPDIVDPDVSWNSSDTSQNQAIFKSFFPSQQANWFFYKQGG